ncbi:hypothetical protein [Streptomyces sp. NK15101]|uniref:hypothetical protein n=1 Tax=Streptomyces sp. NK15101 TaxID=2873261 RepID=UPI001CEC7263|nr:hypothetical protein [Streptomyces sp. NK15101]
MSADQERLYRSLLRGPRSTPDDVHHELAMPDVSRVMEELRTLGVVTGASTPVAPAVAVELLVRRRVEEAQRRLSDLGLAWDVLSELAEEHRSGRSVRMAEQLTDGPAAARRMRALLEREPREFVQLEERARERADAASDAVPSRRLVAAGLRSRIVFSVDALRDPEQETHARSQHHLGVLHRVTGEPLRHLAVVNDAVAFIRTDPSDPGAGTLEIRQPGVVKMLSELFEGTWARARELDDLPLSPIEQRVLHALTRHDTDETAARSINVSVRKFRAHVADLMGRLGANTRFQAALRAKERGWL